jgi:glutathione S-transferase
MLLVDDEPVFGSQVIVQFLESLSPNRGKVIPPYENLMERTKVLTMEALGDGIVEACLALRYL